MINSLSDRNLLIFTLYVICVSFVFYRIINSVQDKVKITTNQKAIASQLEFERLQDLINIQFPVLAKQSKLAGMKDIFISINNKSDRETFYLDWDRSVLTDFEGRSRRVIHKNPSMTLESQVESVIGAGQTLKESFTAEDVVKFVADTGLANDPLFDLNKLKNGSPGQKKLYSEFMTKVNDLKFSLSLALRRVQPAAGSPTEALPAVQLSPETTDRGTKTYFLFINFTVEKMPWTEAVSWRPRKP